MPYYPTNNVLNINQALFEADSSNEIRVNYATLAEVPAEYRRPDYLIYIKSDDTYYKWNEDTLQFESKITGNGGVIDSITAGTNITIGGTADNVIISTVTNPTFNNVVSTLAPSTGLQCTNKTYVDAADLVLQNTKVETLNNTDGNLIVNNTDPINLIINTNTTPSFNSVVLATQSNVDHATRKDYVDAADSLNLKIANNLSDLNNVVTSRANLNVYSTTQVDNLQALDLKIANNLSDLNNIVTSRTNLNVYSTSQTDALDYKRGSYAPILYVLRDIGATTQAEMSFSTTTVSLISNVVFGVSPQSRAFTDGENVDMFFKTVVDRLPCLMKLCIASDETQYVTISLNSLNSTPAGYYIFACSVLNTTITTFPSGTVNVFAFFYDNTGVINTTLNNHIASTSAHLDSSIVNTNGTRTYFLGSKIKNAIDAGDAQLISTTTNLSSLTTAFNTRVLDGNTDVTITAPIATNLLAYNGTQWVNAKGSDQLDITPSILFNAPLDSLINSNTQTMDTSIHALIGTLTNLGAPNLVTGKLGNAIHFLAINNQYINFGYASYLDFMISSQYTINFWINSTQSTSSQRIICGAGTGANGAGWWITSQGSNNRIEFSLCDTSTTRNLTIDWNFTGGIFDGNWHMITITHGTVYGGNDDADVKLYLDGILREDVKNNVSNTLLVTDNIQSGQPFYIGQLSSGFTTLQNATIDNLTVFNFRMQDMNVTSLYNNGTGKATYTDITTELNHVHYQSDIIGLNSRLVTNETNIATNTSNIATNTTNITTLTNTKIDTITSANNYIVVSGTATSKTLTNRCNTYLSGTCVVSGGTISVNGISQSGHPFIQTSGSLLTILDNVIIDGSLSISNSNGLTVEGDLIVLGTFSTGTSTNLTCTGLFSCKGKTSADTFTLGGCNLRTYDEFSVKNYTGTRIYFNNTNIINCKSTKFTDNSTSVYFESTTSHNITADDVAFVNNNNGSTGLSTIRLYNVTINSNTLKFNNNSGTTYVLDFQTGNTINSNIFEMNSNSTNAGGSGYTIYFGPSLIVNSDKFLLKSNTHPTAYAAYFTNTVSIVSKNITFFHNQSLASSVAVYSVAGASLNSDLIRITITTANESIQWNGNIQGLYNTGRLPSYLTDITSGASVTGFSNSSYLGVIPAASIVFENIGAPYTLTLTTGGTYYQISPPSISTILNTPLSSPQFGTTGTTGELRYLSADSAYIMCTYRLSYNCSGASNTIQTFFLYNNGVQVPFTSCLHSSTSADTMSVFCESMLLLAPNDTLSVRVATVNNGSTFTVKTFNFIMKKLNIM